MHGVAQFQTLGKLVILNMDKIEIAGLSICIFGLMIVLIYWLKNGSLNGSAEITRDKTPIRYWNCIFVIIVVIIQLGRMLFRIIHFPYDRFP